MTTFFKDKINNSLQNIISIYTCNVFINEYINKYFMEGNMLNRKAMVSLIMASGLALCATAHAADNITGIGITPASTVAKASAPININTADLKAFESVKGLGPAKAQSIIDYRTKHGNFQSLQDLENVPGIGPKLLAKIQGQLTVK
jgi:comEA protein